ncbi:MAG: O-antigen ligase family protein [Butyrivibrio sp.]|nr:O-antigen ligase family protein [Butyrivibrio sp.]
MFGILLGKKEYHIDVSTLAFIDIAFIILSAGTKWGYIFRPYACYGLIILAMINIAITRRVNLSKITLFYSVLLIMMLINCYFSYDRLVSFNFFVEYLSVFLFCITTDLSNFDSRLFKVIDVLTIVVAISIIISVPNPAAFARVFQFMLGDVSTFISRGNNGQYSGFAKEIAEAAVLMNYGLAVQWAEAFTKGIHKKNVIKMIVLFIGLLLTTKRTLLVVAIVAPLLFFFLSRIQITTKVKAFIAIVFVGVIAYIIVSNVPALSTVIGRFQDLDTDESHGGREILWTYSRMMFDSNPTWGIGYGTFNSFFNTNYGNEIIKMNWIAYGHNIYLEALGEIGIVGTILFFMPVMAAVIIGIYEIRTGHEQQRKYRFFFWTYVIIMYIIYGYSGNCIYYIQQLVMFVLAVSRIFRNKEASVLE